MFHHSTKAFADAGMNLRMWASNSDEFTLTAVTAEVGIRSLSPNDIWKVHYRRVDFQNERIMPETKARAALHDISRALNEQLNQFWVQWKTSYLGFLREGAATQIFQRTRKRHQLPPRIGDVVIIQEEPRKREAWRLAKIT